MQYPLSAIKNTQPRREHGDIEALKASIKDVGLVHPPTVDENLNLLAGRRRYQALMELYGPDYRVDMTVLPVNGDRLKAFRVALQENLARKPLTDPEVATAIKEYDELKRAIEGNARQGERTDLTLLQCDKVPWTQAQTARDLGISQPAVAKAIKIATAIEEHPELARKRSGAAILQQAKEMEHLARARQEQEAQLPQGVTLLQGDFREALQGLRGSVDVIFTDPPYDRDSLPLYDALGGMAAQALKVGGYLITYSGQAFLPEVMGLLGAHLTYYWTFCLPFEVRQNHLRLWKKNIWNAWKPLLIYCKGEAGPHQWCTDMVRVPTIEKAHSKDHHKWGQPVAEAVEILRAFTPVGGLVVDPFVGSGTTLIAAKLVGLRALGVEKEEDTYLIAKARIAEAS